MSLHQRRTHPQPVEGCWACKIGNGPNVAPSATPTRTGAALWQAKEEERTLTVDGEAYKRLRADGYQPMTIAGSADLERDATTRYEIESGNLVRDKSQLGEALTFFEDTHGHEATTPASTPLGGDAA